METASSPRFRRPGSPQAAARGLFQCSECQRSYKRLEHLSRHVRSHTQEKPYSCQVCSKAFSRFDLLKRHTSIHEGASEDRTGQKRRKAAYEPRRTRQACTACTRLHLRCSDDKPCTRCRNRGLVCERDDVAHPNEPMSGQNSGLVSESAASPNDGASPGQIALAAGPRAASAMLQRAEPSSSQTAGATTSPHERLAPHMNLDWFDPGVLETTMLQARATSHGQPPQASDYELTRGVAFGFPSDLGLTQTNCDSWFNYSPNALFDDTTFPRPQQSSLDVGVLEGLDARTTAFVDAGRRFRTQAHGQSHLRERENLLLPDDNQARQDSSIPVALPLHAKLETLGYAGRDRVMALIFGQAQPSRLSLSRGSFPSLELLDNLLHYYLASTSCDLLDWVHFTNLAPRDAKCPELFAMMIAAGATLAPDDSLRRLGFAMQEILRTAIPAEWERDNLRIRDLSTLQAYLLLLDVGVWSGNSRKIELSESFTLPLVTMVRRGGFFKATSYKALPALLEEVGSDLQAKWLAWIEEESWKRFVYRLLHHDTAVSMSLSVPPLVPLSEMALPLPSAKALWEAPDAATWKRLLFSEFSNVYSGLSPIDCLSNPDLLASADENAHSKLINAKLAFLDCCWRVVATCRQLKSTSKFRNLAVTAMHEDLTKSIQYFDLTCLTSSSAEESQLALLAHTQLMHLNVSIDEIEACAGVEGREEILRNLPLVKAWSGTAESRKAIWHAGQVLGCARQLSKGMLHGCRAIALYHASLTLWSYSLARHGSEHPEVGQDVYLDQPETIGVQQFTSVGRGKPSLTKPDGRGHALVGAPELVMEAAIHVLRGNSLSTLDSAPPLVANLVRLMDVLQHATAAR